MTSRFQQMRKLAVPAMLMALMAGCATNSELEKVQRQADEAKAIALEARNTANAASSASASAEKTSSEASGYSAAAVKSSEAAVQVAVQAQKTVNEATIAIPWMRFDPATGRFLFSWVLWPSMEMVAAPPPAPGAQAPAPAPATAPNVIQP